MQGKWRAPTTTSNLAPGVSVDSSTGNGKRVGRALVIAARQATIDVQIAS
jgi:hypothetical protein